MAGVLGDIERLILQIPDAWSKAEAQGMAQGEDMVGEAIGIRVVFLDAQIRLMVEEAIKHVRCVPSRRGDHLRVEGRIWSEMCV